MNRRKFLRNLGIGTAALGAWSDLERIAAAASLGNAPKAAGEDYRALVCLFMFGGNDGNNTVIPTSTTEYNQYATGRTSVLALPRAQLLNLTVSNTPGRTFALHPAMAGLQGLFNQGHAAIVANSGPLLAPTSRSDYQARRVPIPPDLFSHSDQQAQWQSSISNGAPRTGWGGRLGDLLQSSNGTNSSSTLISVSGNNLFEVGTTLVSFKVSPGNHFGFDFYQGATSSDPLSQAITAQLAATSGNALDGAWNNVISRAIENQRVLSSALASAPAFKTVFPNSGLGSQLQMIAKLVSIRQALGLKRQVFFASLGGFDTHGETQLQDQQELLGDVSASLTALYSATAEIGADSLVTSFTASDFNRTFPSNGRGSDHAWGNHHFVVGGAVKGGAMYGTFPTLVRGGPDDTDTGGLWIPTTSVDQYSATLASWFGVSAADMPTIFPNLGNFTSPNLGFV